MGIIEIKQLTKDYGGHKGIFDLTLTIDEGEVFGFLGPNGSGKTTTIRNLMGFSNPTSGQCFIRGRDCRTESALIQRDLGYLPGEIAFIEEMKGIEFIRFVAEMKKIKDFSRALQLIDYFELDPKGSLKRMSKGMKQKVGLVCAFMQDASILVLDEPSSGLDPLMQNKFISLVLSEKRRGKTIFMSSHTFEEVEKCCDRAAIIKEGRLIVDEKMSELKKLKRKVYRIEFSDERQARMFAAKFGPVDRIARNEVLLTLTGDVSSFIRLLGSYEIRELDVMVQTLEELFLHYYGGANI